MIQNLFESNQRKSSPHSRVMQYVPLRSIRVVSQAITLCPKTLDSVPSWFLGLKLVFSNTDQADAPLFGALVPIHHRAFTSRSPRLHLTVGHHQSQSSSSPLGVQSSPGLSTNGVSAIKPSDSKLSCSRQPILNELVPTQCFPVVGVTLTTFHVNGCGAKNEEQRSRGTRFAECQMPMKTSKTSGPAVCQLYPFSHRPEMLPVTPGSRVSTTVRVKCSSPSTCQGPYFSLTTSSKHFSVSCQVDRRAWTGSALCTEETRVKPERVRVSVSLITGSGPGPPLRPAPGAAARAALRATTRP